MICRTIEGEKKDILIEMIELEQNDFVIPNQYAKEVFDYIRAHMTFEGVAYDLMRKGTMLALLRIKGEIKGLFTWKKQIIENYCMVYIEDLIISKKYRGTPVMMYFVDNVFSTLSEVLEMQKKSLLLYATTRYSSVLKYLKKHFNIVTEGNLLFTLMETYFKDYLSQYKPAMIYDEERKVLKLSDTTNLKREIPNIILPDVGELDFAKGEYQAVFFGEGKAYKLPKKKESVIIRDDMNILLRKCFVSQSFGQKAANPDKSIRIAVVDTGISEENKAQVLGGVHIYCENEEIRMDGDYISQEKHGNNGVKILKSLCPNASLLIVRALSAQNCHWRQLVEGILWAADQGADIIALGGSVTSEKAKPDLKKACDYAVSKGSIIVAPKDIFTRNESYPFSFSNVIGASITPANNLFLLDREHHLIKTTSRWIDEEELSSNLAGKAFIGSCTACYYIAGYVAKCIEEYNIHSVEDVFDCFEAISGELSQVEEYLFS